MLCSTAGAQSLMQQALLAGRQAAQDSARTHYLLAARLAYGGRYAQALTHMRRAMEFAPNEPQLRLDYGLLLFSSGDSTAGIRELRNLASAPDPYPPAVVQLGDYYYERGDSTRAINLYTSMATRPNPFVTAIVRLGGVASERGNRTAAIELYRRAVQVDSTNIEAIVSLGAGYMIEDRYRDAVQLFQRATRLDPGNQLLTGMLTMATDRRNSYQSEMNAGKLRARIIVVERRADAEDIIGRLNNGADFVTLAQQYSTHPSKDVGGDIWFFSPGEFVPEIENAVQATPVGQHSSVISTSFGYVVIYRLN